MAKSYSIDLRARAVALVEDGESRREAARVLGLGASTAIRWIERWTTTGSVAAKARAPFIEHKLIHRWRQVNVAASQISAGGLILRQDDELYPLSNERLNNIRAELYRRTCAPGPYLRDKARLKSLCAQADEVDKPSRCHRVAVRFDRRLGERHPRLCGWSDLRVVTPRRRRLALALRS